ncbi:MAG: FeoA family protein [Anaerolineae bacterium]|jgi:ferrous iron transport protein A|nr:FeoA family protein [Anaerolineae bacterium]
MHAKKHFHLWEHFRRRERKAATDGRAVTLGALPAGKTATVAELQGGRGFTTRMAALGFTPGAQVTMIQNFGRGPVIVMVRGTRIALGRGEAEHVWISANGGEAHEES